MLALGALGLRRRTVPAGAWSVIVLLPALALVGALWYSSTTITPDGDSIKATYVLSATPTWAFGFAFAFDRVAAGRLARLTGAVLLLGVLANVRFLIAGSPLGGLL